VERAGETAGAVSVEKTAVVVVNKQDDDYN
jgi:hypothetical protein